jgi:hypothetical protein
MRTGSEVQSALSLDKSYRRGITLTISTFGINGKIFGTGNFLPACPSSPASLGCQIGCFCREIACQSAVPATAYSG